MHNLGRMNWGDPDGATDWNVAFDTAATELMTQRPGDIAELFDHQNHHLAAPTPEHLIPLFYIAGIAQADRTPVSVLTDGPFMSSLSMTSYVVPARQSARTAAVRRKRNVTSRNAPGKRTSNDLTSTMSSSPP